MISPQTALPAAFAALLFSSATFASAGIVTEQMFIDTHVGNCAAYTGPSTGTQCYEADGTTTYSDESYGSDNGTWEMRGDEVCVKWSRETATACNVYIKQADGSFSAATGYKWTIQ